jgi:hypothetical protein
MLTVQVEQKRYERQEGCERKRKMTGRLKRRIGRINRKSRKDRQAEQADGTGTAARQERAEKGGLMRQREVSKSMQAEADRKEDSLMKHAGQAD